MDETVREHFARLVEEHPTVETLGEYFAHVAEHEDPEDLIELMFVLSLGEYNGNRGIRYYPHWKPLLAHVESVIAEWANEQADYFRLANVMNAAAQRLLNIEKLPPPKQWLPTIKTLRTLGEMAAQPKPG